MARGVLAARSQIEASLDVDPMIFHQSVDALFVKFITEPLRHLRSTGFNFKDSTFVIIIDRLGEYQGHDIQSGLVKSLVAALHRPPLRIRILIASRRSTSSLHFLLYPSSSHTTRSLRRILRRRG